MSLILLNEDMRQKDETLKALCIEMWASHLKESMEVVEAWEQRFRIAELRKSCGVESKADSAVNVRMPRRYDR